MDVGLRDFILERKRDVEQEYTIHLFEFCNLSCQFCWQDHNDIRGIDTVRSLMPKLKPMLARESRDRVILNFMGGEIFAPKIFTHQLLEDYYYIIDSVKMWQSELDKKIIVNWVTNLVFDAEQRDFVKSLLQYADNVAVKSRLTTSYDALGRFNRGDLEKWKSNVEYFRSDIEGVSMLLSGPNIRNLIKNRDTVFQWIYNSGLYIYFDYYMPDKTADYQAPSDQELYDAFVFLIDNYPQVHPVAEWINYSRNFASCRSSKLLLWDGTECMCGNLVQEEKSIKFYRSKIQTNDNSGIEENFLKKYDCVSCQWLDRCTFSCFMQHDNKYRDEFPDCVYARIFDYAHANDKLLA